MSEIPFDVVNYLNEITKLNNELVNLQRDLNKKNLELKDLNDQKNKLLGMAAHDLRNPLSVIHTASSYLLEETSLTNDQYEIIKLIKDTSNYALNLVNELLSFAAIESGKVTLKFTEFNLNNLILDVVKTLKIIAASKKISIIFESEINDVIVNGDINKIRQVVENLISNAIKFSYPENTIKIIIKKNEENNVVVCIKDNGVGILCEEISKLFMPFSKTSSKSTKGEPNTGLGLAICKKIIESHNGKIWVESLKDKGTTFYFSLPTFNNKELLNENNT